MNLFQMMGEWLLLTVALAPVVVVFGGGIWVAFFGDYNPFAKKPWRRLPPAPVPKH